MLTTYKALYRHHLIWLLQQILGWIIFFFFPLWELRFTVTWFTQGHRDKQWGVCGEAHFIFGHSQRWLATSSCLLDFTLIDPYRNLKMLGSQITDQLELTKRLNQILLFFLVINNPSEALVRKTLPLIWLSLATTSKDLQLVESQPCGWVGVLGNVSALARFLTSLFIVCVCQWVWCDLLSVVSPMASFSGDNPDWQVWEHLRLDSYEM